MRTLIIGDIHGCYLELQDLLDRAGLASGDAVIALGDCLDRGPASPLVLDFFREHLHARSLLGNHERKHLRAARGQLKPALSQVIARSQFGEAYPAALRFLETFPLWLELPEAILVHGYLEPGLPLEDQSELVLCGTMGGERILRERYAQPWYALYDLPRPVIVGHRDYLGTGQPFVYAGRVFGLDTSCVRGRTLTGLLLPAWEFISVPSRADHWSDVRRQYRRDHPAAAPRPPRSLPAWDAAAQAALAEIVAWALAENARVLARLRERASFDDLPPRQQAQRYSAEIGQAPLAPLLHLARRGELDLERARQVLKSPQGAVALSQTLANPFPPETPHAPY